MVLVDKKLYVLCDVIVIVDFFLLIVSLIMSKKIVVGVDVIVLDVIIGDGVFMKNIEDVRCLVKIMINIGKLVNWEIVVVILDMLEFFGEVIGNSLEVVEVIEIL